MKKLAVVALLAGLLLTPALAGDAAPLGTFLRGSPAGCFLARNGAWEPLGVPKLPFSVGTCIKTDATGWGTLLFPFGSLILRGDSQVRIEPAGLLLQTGTFKAFVRRSAQGFRFRIPGATLGVRGTVFSAEANGGLQVDAGAVEVGAGNQSPVLISAGGQWGEAQDDGPIPGVVQEFETALRAEHDGKSEAAVAGFLRLIRNPALEGLTSFRTHLVEKALLDFARAGLPPSHPLAGAIRQAVREFPAAWYNAVEGTLALEEAKTGRALMAYAADARRGADRDPRELVAEALLAEMTVDDAGMDKALADLRTRTQNPSPESTGEFWGTTLTYLQAMNDPQSVSPARITAMIAPNSLARLSPKAAARRVALATRLPADILEAQGLYFLLKALWAEGKADKANWLMAYFRSHYPGSPWLDRAEKIMSLDPKPRATESRPTSSQASASRSQKSGSPRQGAPGLLTGAPPTPAGAQKTVGAPLADTATGTTATSESSEVTIGAAESLGDSF